MRPEPFRDCPQQHADRGGDDRISENGADPARGQIQRAAEGRIAAVEPFERGPDQRRIEKDHHRVLHDIKRK